MPTIKFYKAIAGSLSEPSKMPGFGYGLPALKTCNVGSKLAKIPGTPCADCYACKGHYTFANVKDAQEKRLQAVLHNPSWVDAMTAMIESKKSKYFRWHDSGDLISLDHLSKICQIAVRLPEYHFWLPTHEHGLIRQYRELHGDFPSNLIVRLSTPKVDGRPVTTDLCTSSVHKNAEPHGFACPASKQGNKCGDCRACWNKEIKNVSYKFH